MKKNKKRKSADEILEQLRREDRLLSESAVIKAVQKALVSLGYEPLGEKQTVLYEAIENVPTAYNVEKTIEQIKKVYEYCDKTLCNECKYYKKDRGCSDAAILEIVRRGGVK